LRLGARTLLLYTDGAFQLADPDQGVVIEIFIFEPERRDDGQPPPTSPRPRR
jgi:hypothetical protein